MSLRGSGRKVWWGGRLFEAGRLLTFSAFRMGAYSRWALIRGWALIRINTVSESKSILGNMQAQAPVHVANVQVGRGHRQLPSELDLPFSS